jgi:enoyl-[acyl-carrier-protein] reductase (NADH)
MRESLSCQLYTSSLKETAVVTVGILDNPSIAIGISAEMRTLSASVISTFLTRADIVLLVEVLRNNLINQPYD